jgi:hypothetical protein
VAIWERPSPPHQCEDSGRGLLPILLDLDVPWATKIVVIQELRDPPGQYSTFTFCPSTKMLILAKPSSRPGETPLCGSISIFFFQATVPFSMLWIWPLTATALLLPHALRLFRILNALFWTSYPLASDVLCLCIVIPSRHAAFRKTLKNHDD